MPCEQTGDHIQQACKNCDPGSFKMQRAAPAVLVGQHVAVTGRTVALEEGIGSWNNGTVKTVPVSPQ